jgi:hypothetical protein
VRRPGAAGVAAGLADQAHVCLGTERCPQLRGFVLSGMPGTVMVIYSVNQQVVSECDSGDVFIVLKQGKACIIFCRMWCKA